MRRPNTVLPSALVVATWSVLASCTPPVVADPCLNVTCDAPAHGSNACVSGACVVSCDAPYVKDSAGTACVSPDTVEACGPDVRACPTDPHGTTACTAGACTLTCEAPRVLDTAGTACVSPNTVEACGADVIACPTSPYGNTACIEGQCVLTCSAPYLLSAGGDACVSPNTTDACGLPAVTCPEPEFATATCSETGECGWDCPPGTDKESSSETCVPRFETCFALLRSGFTASGDYLLRGTNGPVLRHCDQETNGGGWLRITPDLLGATVVSNATTEVVSNDDGAVIRTGATVGTCSIIGADFTPVAPGQAWTQIRYTESFENEADCWSLFGDTTFANETTPHGPNLIPYDPAVDTFTQSVGLGFAGADAFTPPTNVCSEGPHFWGNPREAGTAHGTLIQRRSDAEGDAGVGTFSTCSPGFALARWQYSSIAVRECPFTADACGTDCAPCPASANGGVSCEAGTCTYTCAPENFSTPTGCAADCAAGDPLPACTVASTDTCTDAHLLFNERNAYTSLAGTLQATVGAATTRVPGFTGGGVHFPGTSDAGDGLSLGISAGRFGTNDFTVAFRFKMAHGGRSGDVFGNRSDGSHGNFFQIRYNVGSFAAEIDEDGGGTNYVAVGTATGLDDAQWHHLAVVRAGAQLRIFVDGTRVSTGTGTGIANVDNANPLLFGATNLPIITGAPGDFDDLRLYRGALSDEQVLQIAGICTPT